MNELLIKNAFRNMAAEKLFSNEVITVIFHSADPGVNGTLNSFGTDNGILNMFPVDWEVVGDTVGTLINNTEKNVGKLSDTNTTRINYFSLWREDGTFLGYRKFNQQLTLRPGKSFKIARGVIVIKVLI